MGRAVAGGRYSFLDFRAPRHGKPVRELQTTDIGTRIEGMLSEGFAPRGGSPLLLDLVPVGKKVIAFCLPGSTFPKGRLIGEMPYPEKPPARPADDSETQRML